MDGSLVKLPSDNCDWSLLGLDNGLAPNRRQAIIWTNGGLGYWRIYTSLGLNELNKTLDFSGHNLT